MEKFVINGGKKLYGEIDISGAKNAAVAIIPATILAEDICRIENIPDIRDVQVMVKILIDMGATVRYINSNTLEIDTRYIRSFIIPYEMTKYSRSSYYLLGALLGRYNHAKVAMPGGCNFGGVRPIDFHLKGFAKLGAKITNDNGMIDAEAESLNGNVIYFDKVSVGATVNIMLAAVKARGLTIIENAAREPHIVDLASFLILWGQTLRVQVLTLLKSEVSVHSTVVSIQLSPTRLKQEHTWWQLLPQRVISLLRMLFRSILNQ